MENFGVDFSDVFGGPPRRFSNPESRNRENSQDSSELDSDAAAVPRNPWSLTDEKPVFGAESVSRRTRGGDDDFFGDIFQGDSPSRSFSRDLYGSSPLSSSVPTKFRTDLNANKASFLSSRNDGISNVEGNGHTLSPSASTSRLSSLTKELQEEISYETPLYRKSPLSQKVDEESTEREVEIDSGQFHFSIYKWPGSGVPLLMALAGGGSKSRLRAEKCASSNGRTENESEKSAHFPIFNEPKSVPLNVDLKKSEAKVPESEGNETHSKHKRDKKRAHAKKGKPLVSETPLQELINEDDDHEQGQAAKGKDIKVKSMNTKEDVKSVDGLGGSRVKGKVGDFVKLFDHDSSKMIKNVFSSHSGRWKKMDVNVKDDCVTNVVKNDEEVHVSNKAKMAAEASSKKEDEVFNKSRVKQEPYSKKSARKTSGLSMNEKKAPLISESHPSNHGVEVEDESFPGFFSVEEVSQVEEKVSEASDESEHIQTSNTKIQQWSSGRKGNIRSLLSTLQFVLWPESGWKPVPLVDLIEGSTVKRAYQRALLCLHPDKLQQKGAAPHQKYLAQQVFEILQEAWDLFNTIGAI